MIRTIMSHPRTRQAGVLGALAAALLLCPAAQADTKVGVTAAVNPEATGKPPSSNERVLYVGIDMQADERIRTTANGRVQLLFLDGSALSIGPNSDVVIDKYVYNPDNADNPGELAFRATKGVFRLIGGKISKVNPVIMHTSSASIGVRGSGALINAPEGGEKSTAVFMHGKDMFVQCDQGDCQGEKKTVTRPGSAIDFGQGLLSSPYLAKADLIKAIQGGFEKPSGLGEIAPAAGPGGPAGGGTPDDRLATTNIANANSGTTANTLVAPPPGPNTNANKVEQTAQDAISNSSNDAPVSSTTPPGDTDNPPPPPPLPFLFTEGRLSRQSVAGSVTPATPTSPPTFTPNTANYTPIIGALVDESGTYIPDSSSGNPRILIVTPTEALYLPYLLGQSGFSFIWEDGSYSTAMDQFEGTGFVATDGSFFDYFGQETAGALRRFHVYGGQPTAVFPTSGYATHLSLGLRLPYLGFNASDPIVPFEAGGAGVTISPLYSVYSSNIPTNSNTPIPAVRPVTLQSSLVILGQGASQQSLFMGGTGTYVQIDSTGDVAMVGTAAGSYRPSATGVPTRFFTGTTTDLTANGNAIFGPNADHMVVGPNLITGTPGTFVRNTDTLGFAQPLDTPTGEGYYYQTAYTKTANPVDLGTSRTSQTLSGYVGGIADIRHPDTTITSEVFQGVTGTASDVQITTDPSSNRLVATFQLQGVADPSPVVLQFGSLTGFSSSSSAFIDDNRFGASESPSISSTVDGVAVGARLFMVTSDVVPLATDGGFLPVGVTLCACEYLKWGWWTGDLNHNTTGDPELGARDRAHLSTWVAGTLPTLVEIPTTGTATFAGHIIGNVVNNGASYLAAGNFNHGWDFATKSGNILAGSSFDGMALTGGANSVNGRDFNGVMNATGGINGSYNGSFFKGAGDPTKSMGGQFNLSGGTYVAGGTFAAQKVTPP